MQFFNILLTLVFYMDDWPSNVASSEERACDKRGVF
jgi:hypothetical protein